MNIYVLSLIVVPIIFAALFLLSDNKNYYKLLSYLLCAFGVVFSILLAVAGPTKFTIEGGALEAIQAIVIIAEIAIIAFIFYVATKRKRWHVFSIAVVQTILFLYTLYKELFVKRVEQISFNIDYLSIVMVLIISIVGTLIVVFANGYISEYEHHKKLKSKQKMFYSVICVFLAAMNGLVMSDSLSYVYFFWEITTLCSFLLISYNGDEEGWNSGFRALYLNLIGGVCFAIGNILFENTMDITTLSQIAKHGKMSGFLVVPVFLLCAAGFAKSAQFPFQSWLLGAMVAPTPVSALLHSSTMVKAGVYLIIKLSPAYAGTSLGTAIAIYGGFTFLICSAIAVTQSNAKRVLAYSTIANLGLIICSAGMGTGLAITAAIVLIIFHAISKALLFLCTGQIEHTIGSRDIEDMQGLIHVAPGLALITSFGIISMILPPFGVLITKLISMEAAASNPFIAIFLVLGSALTTLYYLKWIGSILSFPEVKLEKKNGADPNIYFPLSVLSVMVLVTSIFVGPVYSTLVAPEMSTLFPNKLVNLQVSKANIVTNIGSFNDEIVFIVLAAALIIGFIVRKLLVTNTTVKNVYMCGENNLEDDKISFRSANGVYEKANVGNLYLSQVFNERTLTLLGYIVSISLLLIVVLGGLL